VPPAQALLAVAVVANKAKAKVLRFKSKVSFMLVPKSLMYKALGYTQTIRTTNQTLLIQKKPSVW
jgi:hypothetical protein